MPRARKRATLPQEAFADSWSLWNALLQYGDVEPNGRDREFIPAIRRSLTLSGTQAFEQELRDQQISTNSLIEAIFTVTAPYGEMLGDVLVMFEAARARASQDNIAVVFNFDESLPALEFDLSAFRQLQFALRPLPAAREEVAWTHESIRAVGAQLRDLTSSPVRSLPAGVGRWLERYDNERRWPAWEPPPIVFGSGSLETATRTLALLWSRIVWASRSVGEQRSALEGAQFAVRIGDATDSVVAQSFAAPWTLKNLDRENWAGDVLRSLAIASVSPQSWPTIARWLVQFIDALPRSVVDAETRVNELVETLNLPIWQRRNDLYAAWVGAKIVQALGEEGVRVHSVGGRLVFSGSGTHLATVSAGLEVFHVWCELNSHWKSPDKPRGKGRTKAIQPDYSLTGDPVTDPDSTFLVVEVKHYLKPATESFAAALQDYADGRPRAGVILVDYGEAGDAILGSVAERVRDRCHLIEELAPSNQPALNRFSGYVGDAVRLFAPAGSRPQPLSNPTYGTVKDTPSETQQSTAHDNGLAITLTWMHEPADLDLHVWVRDATDSAYVSYRNPKATHGSIDVRLDKDCKTAPGAESVFLETVPEYLRCAVHNFSGQPPLSSAGAKVVVTIGGWRVEYVAPSGGEGAWWLVLEFWRPSRLVTWNSVTTDLPDLLDPMPK